MASNKITKEALADALKVLLKDRPLSKISVKDITICCGMSRNSFYYHFRDKYELIRWIFHSDLEKTGKPYKDPEKLADSFMNVCNCLYCNRGFYLACLQYAGQNSLFEVLYQLYKELWEENLRMRYMGLTVQLTERELDIMARLDAHALVGIITEWVNEGMRNNYINYFEEIGVLLDTEPVSGRDECYGKVPYTIAG